MDRFWLRDEQVARIAPHRPDDTRGKERVDDRRVISGIEAAEVGVRRSPRVRRLAAPTPRPDIANRPVRARSEPQTTTVMAWAARVRPV